MIEHAASSIKGMATDIGLDTLTAGVVTFLMGP
jgi:hypothetical protein